MAYSTKLVCWYFVGGIASLVGVRDLSGNGLHLCSPHSTKTQLNLIDNRGGEGFYPISGKKSLCHDYTQVIDALHMSKPGRSWFVWFDFLNDSPLKTGGAQMVFGEAGTNAEHMNEPLDPGGSFGFVARMLWDATGNRLNIYTDNDVDRNVYSSYITTVDEFTSWGIYYNGADNLISIYINSATPDVDDTYLWIGERTDAPFSIGGNGLKFNQDYPTTGAWGNSAYYGTQRNFQLYTIDDLDSAAAATLKTTLESTYIPWLLEHPTTPIPAEVWT